MVIGEIPAPNTACTPLRQAQGGLVPIVLNAANEVAVAAFLDRRIGFIAIPDVIRSAMDAYERSAPRPVKTLEDVRRIDAWATRFAADRTGGVKLKV